MQALQLNRILDCLISKVLKSNDEFYIDILFLIQAKMKCILRIFLKLRTSQQETRVNFESYNALKVIDGFVDCSS